MHGKRWSLALILFAAFAIAGSAAAQTKRQLVIGSTSSSSSVFVYFVALSKAINQYAPELNATIVETGATVDNLRRLERGQIDLGLVTQESAAAKFAGTDPFKGAPNQKLRALIVFDDLPNMWVVREDSGIRTLAGLKGKPFNAGINGSATELMSNIALDALGIKIEPFKGATKDAVEAIQDRHIVGFSKAGWHDAAILNIMATTKLTFLTFTPEEEQKVTAKFPPGVAWFTVPAGTYEGQPTVRTFGFSLGVVTTTALSAEDGYAILKAQELGFKEMSSAYPDIAGKNLPAKTAEASGILLHAGAVKFLREKGVAIPEKLIPPEAK